MGQLLSRALRRFSICSSNNNNNNNSQTTNQQSQTAQETSKGEQVATNPQEETVQRIPVGQSIDSADYATFKDTNKELKNKASRETNSESDTSAGCKTQEASDEQAAVPQVEEAIIKIQAYVRGHLTRKALKDAKDTKNSSVPPLGQSQFDEESLIRNPPSAVFSIASLNSIPPPAADAPKEGRLTPKLESIAEETNSSIEKREQQLSMVENSISPVPSEANASIDLNCDTPASTASLDILDHQAQQAADNNKIASVLHYQAEQQQQQQVSSEANFQDKKTDNPQVVEPILVDGSTPERRDSDGPLPDGDGNTNSLGASNSASLTRHSIDSAEAAAIRIQSAFRGYHTRKHSPYRRRSPNVGADLEGFGEELPLENGFGASRLLRQQAEELDFGQATMNSNLVEQATESRASRRDTVLDAARRCSSPPPRQVADEEENESTIREALPISANLTQANDSIQDLEEELLNQIGPESVARSSLGAISLELDNTSSQAVLASDADSRKISTCTDEGGANLVEEEAELDDEKENFNSNDKNNNNIVLDELHEIELESDDIERRDPRGQASIERASQSQEQPTASSSEQVLEEEARVLVVESPDEAFASGPSSPALQSSSNGDDESDQANDSSEEDESKQQQQPLATRHSNQGKNNRKRNRNNKKRGNKK